MTTITLNTVRTSVLSQSVQLCSVSSCSPSTQVHSGPSGSHPGSSTITS